jgi:hypothetical protein
MGGEEAMALAGAQAPRVDNAVLCPHVRGWEAKARLQDVSKEFAKLDVNESRMVVLTR